MVAMGMPARKPHKPEQEPKDAEFNDRATTDAPPDPMPEHVGIPLLIGSYHIRRLIGHGGMGSVYEAVQEQPRRIVALKVLRTGTATRSALRRFAYESQVLGRLKHSGIAQIFEAGTHVDNGVRVPFFALEYIANAKYLTEYAEQKDLSTIERVNLFIRVCDAVHHGHQKGIVHRDLKPQNILVDSEGNPKVIDFGVARATDSDLAVTTQQTEVGALVGTLQYMSPEQVMADPHDIDTRSDVYALGAILYELVCRKLPYDVSSLPITEAIRIIREGVPNRPTSVSAFVKRDLEVIILKAMDKERDRRYRSAADLADDLRRFCSAEPVAARPATLGYQLRLFARRNKTFAIAASVVFTALLITSAVSLTSWLGNRQNDEQFGKFNKFVGVLLGDRGSDSNDDQRDAASALVSDKLNLDQATEARVRLLLARAYADQDQGPADWTKSREQAELAIGIESKLANPSAQSSVWKMAVVAGRAMMKESEANSVDKHTKLNDIVKLLLPYAEQWESIPPSSADAAKNAEPQSKDAEFHEIASTLIDQLAWAHIRLFQTSKSPNDREPLRKAKYWLDAKMKNPQAAYESNAAYHSNQLHSLSLIEARLGYNEAAAERYQLAMHWAMVSGLPPMAAADRDPVTSALWSDDETVGCPTQEMLKILRMDPSHAPTLPAYRFMGAVLKVQQIGQRSVSQDPAGSFRSLLQSEWKGFRTKKTSPTSEEFNDHLTTKMGTIFNNIKRDLAEALDAMEKLPLDGPARWASQRALLLEYCPDDIMVFEPPPNCIRPTDWRADELDLCVRGPTYAVLTRHAWRSLSESSAATPASSSRLALFESYKLEEKDPLTDRLTREYAITAGAAKLRLGARTTNSKTRAECLASAIGILDRVVKAQEQLVTASRGHAGTDGTASSLQSTVTTDGSTAAEVTPRSRENDPYELPSQFEMLLANTFLALTRIEQQPAHADGWTAFGQARTRLELLSTHAPQSDELRMIAELLGRVNSTVNDRARIQPETVQSAPSGKPGN
jgi:serine/threonine protein kinase